MGKVNGDKMLVNEIKAGNQIAFEAMVIKYQPKLLSSLISYTKSIELAEDLCQKTFIRVWQKINTFRGESALFTWIYRIAINLAKNEFSSSYAKASKKTDSLDDIDYEMPSFTSPEADLIGSQLADKIHSYIQNLDIDIKTAFTLIEIDGRSYEEIARIMECPIGTVRSRIFRARQLIVDFINQENI